MFFMRIKINLGSNLELFTTGNDSYQSYTTVVSIHAPAGTTKANVEQLSEVRFQSTPP